MASQVFQNIYAPPVKSQKLVSRDRLFNLLQNNIEKNLIFIYSPPGYGKTALVQSFLESQKCDYAWLNATAELSHIHTFFKHLIYSLRRVKPNFGTNTLQLIESRSERLQLTGERIKAVVNEIMTTFINEFNRVFKEDFILVIDDLHNLDESKWLDEAFNSLFNSMPNNLHLILISRQIPNFNFLPLMEKENMLRIGMEDLVFRFDEITELLKDVYSIDYSDDGIKLLENNLGGWITGIHLILQSFGKDFSNIKVDLQRIPENIFNLLAEEIYKRLEPETQEFLLFTSLLESFDSQMCSTALDLKKSDKIIGNLISKNLFVQHVPSAEEPEDANEYKYQVLFKAYLNSLFNKTYSREKAIQILNKIAKYYLEKKDIISAVNYLLKAKDHQAAIPIIVENFSKMFSEGKFEYLWKWLSTIENEVEILNPHITYYLGSMYKYYIGDLKTSLAYLQKANEMFAEMNDTNALIDCHITKAGVLLNFGRNKEVVKELSCLLKEHTSSEKQANLLYFLAYAYYQNSEYERTIDLLNKCLEISENGKKIKKQADIFNLLGHVELIKGNFRSSVHYYETVLEGRPNLFNRFETLCNLVLLSSQSGKFEKASGYLQMLDDLIRNFPTPVFKIPYLLSRQAYLFESSKFEENLEVLKEINSIAVHMNHKPYIYLSNRLMIDTYYYLHDNARAMEYFELASSLADKDNELENIELSATKVLLCGQNTEEVKAEETLLKAYEYYKTNNFIYPKAQICYRIANYYLTKGNKEKAKKFVEESLNIASQNGYLSFYNRENNYSKNLLEFAFNNNMKKDFLNSVMIN